MTTRRYRPGDEHTSRTGRTPPAGIPTQEPLDDRTTHRATERTPR
jgi:hypothetical protein